MKGEEGWNANRRLLLNSPDPIVPILGTSSAKVTEWLSRQSLDYVMYFIRWFTGGHFTSRGGGCRADDLKADSPLIR
uniref:Ycf15 protein n=2 Tax=Gentianopsis TaxID=50798 RepID=A0A7D5UCY0_9GENT|nr:Ycf15 protein [Gentianopsis grandis]YP_009906682.1 Ycf15 protein [Gentianopsis grandis]QLI52185.1 Ycf15 protein [Gentianopsis grandis]QLI52202.1 Ycf15 protein [Gentianopsis grandis]QOP62811.1 hypothetical protein RF15 [Gentianopsis paludosa]